MEFSAKQIAELLQGTVQGDENIVVNNVCRIEEGEKGKLAFLSNPKYTQYVYDTEASIVIVNEDLVLEHQVKATLIKVKDAYSAFATLLGVYQEYRFAKVGVSSTAIIDTNARLGNDCYIGHYTVVEKNAIIGDNCKIYPQCYIGENVKIGNNVTIFAGVKIYHDVVIGDNCVLNAGVVLGADGFGYAPMANGELKKIPQIGTVILEEGVELGANTCVDRSTMGCTIIHKGTKIDNLCQIGHNVIIGQSTAMSALTGVGGSTKIGNNCFIGGQAGFAGHLSIGDRVKVAAQAGVITTFGDDVSVMDMPAVIARDALKSIVLQRKLPQMEKRLTEVEKCLKDKQNKE